MKTANGGPSFYLDDLIGQSVATTAFAHFSPVASPACRKRSEIRSELPDCVSLVPLMAMTMDPGEISKLCKRHGLWPSGKVPNPGLGLFMLHMASHLKDLSVARELSRYFRDRFPSAASRVRSLAPEELISSMGRDGWPAPLLWAACTDPRSEMRNEAQALIHGIVWKLIAKAGQLRKGLSFLDGPPGEETAGDRHDSDVAGLDDAVKYGNMPTEARTPSCPVAGPSCDSGLPARGGDMEDLQKRLAELSRELSELRQKQSREGVLRRENKKLAYELEQALARISFLEGSSGSSPGKGARAPEEKNIPARDEGRVPSPVVVLHRSEEKSGDCSHCTGRKGCGCPLDGMKVAVVGGLDRLEPEYRKAVSELGAEFLFHTGRCESGTHVLKNLVCKADIVLYITTINSHGALKVVKGMCKKTGKKFQVVQNPGVSSVANTLREMMA